MLHKGLAHVLLHLLFVLKGRHGVLEQVHLAGFRRQSQSRVHVCIAGSFLDRRHGQRGTLESVLALGRLLAYLDLDLAGCRLFCVRNRLIRVEVLVVVLPKSQEGANMIHVDLLSVYHLIISPR